MGNTFGRLFKITTFGESHGEMLGVVIEGCPSNTLLDLEFIRQELDRRKPGQSKITTQRKESDGFQVVSGLWEGKMTGTPLTILVKNTDARSQDYELLRKTFRPGHADLTYFLRYHHYDYRGGGRASARETVARVVAGAIAKQLLKPYGIQIFGYTHSIGNIEIPLNYQEVAPDSVENNLIRCPHEETASLMLKHIQHIRKSGDSIGGTVLCVIRNVPPGIGQPVFDKLQADLAKAIFSINAVKGLEFGSGFEGTKMTGSQHNDPISFKNGKFFTTTNHAGGILGGISNGMDIYFRVAFKPVASIFKQQQTVDRSGQGVLLSGYGRHDPCVVPRAIPVVEAMAAITLYDHLLLAKAAGIV